MSDGKSEQAAIPAPIGPGEWLAQYLDKPENVEGRTADQIVQGALDAMLLAHATHWSRPGIDRAVRDGTRSRGFVLDHTKRADDSKSSPYVRYDQMEFPGIVAACAVRIGKGKAHEGAAWALAKGWAAANPKRGKTAEDIITAAGG